ncbi:MAG: 4-hydroxybenzoate octaprenyltransferase [Alphaproteobacteria bacterium]|nr:4-hydroxybenzoate octaprenyltransferase [Alphaproteobacteria bacterium]
MISLLSDTDISANGLIERFLPSWALPYARLMRLDSPTGTWLLLLPCWWGVAFAAEPVPNLWYMFLFAVGAVVMRGAGCIINDIFDRDIDRQVVRTQPRPLITGEIKLWQALVFLAALLAIGLCILLLFNNFTIGLGVAILPLVFLYPLAKRVTWWPQLVLGLAFNWGALMGWGAINGSIGITAILLYAAGVFWTLGYDTIYAHQDKEDDARVGIKSLALRLSERPRQWVAVFYMASLFLLAIAGEVYDMHTNYYLMLILASGYVFWQLLGWNPDSPADCQKRFRRNRDFGLIILAAIIIGKFV